MPINYNFNEHWYDIIVPLLNTTKVKNAIKKGILGYMNRSCNPDVKFKSYQNIYDYLNNIHGKYYLNINSSPSDYSSCITEIEVEWENNLLEKLEDSGVIKPFPWDNYDDYKKSVTNPELEYEIYRTEYLDPILEPYVNHYKKTHIDSYCLIGGCHWWNPTFGLTLARIVLPNEKWKVRSSEYHTTIVNEEETKIFDILYYIKDDDTFGGNRAYENSGMNLGEIQERNIKENKQQIEKKVNNCKNYEIYDHNFNILNDELEEINKNINKIELILEGLTGTLLNKEYDNEKKNYRIFEFKQKIIEELFPNAKFDVSIDINELDKVISTKKKMKLIQTFNCWHYKDNPKPDKTFIIKSNKPMTRRYIINELIKQNFELNCEHMYLESLEVNNDIIKYITGS